MTSDSSGVNSPFLSLCAQQVISGTSTPECWYFQVLGGNNPNTQDILRLNRTSTQPNVTLQIPDALNIAAGSTDSMGDHSGQLTIGALPSMDTNISAKYVTVVGGYTKSNDAAAAANPLQLFPGWLQNPNSASSALEGALQIGMTVKGAGTTTVFNQLAC